MTAPCTPSQANHKGNKTIKAGSNGKKKNSQWNYMYYVKIALRSASSYFWFSFLRNSRFRQPLKGEKVKYSYISRLSFAIFESNRKLKGSFITPKQWPSLKSKVLDEWNDHFQKKVDWCIPSELLLQAARISHLTAIKFYFTCVYWFCTNVSCLFLNKLVMGFIAESLIYLNALLKAMTHN